MLHVEDLVQRPPDLTAEVTAECEYEVADNVLAPLLLDVLKNLVAIAIGQETLRRPGDRRHLVGEGGVPHVDLVAGRLVVTEIRGHALHEPQRRPCVDGAPPSAAKEHLVLENVGELVLNQSLQLAVRQIDRQHHPVADGGRKRPHPLGNETDHDVGLLELGVGRVADHRHRFEDLVIELVGDVVIRAFREGGNLLQSRFDAVVVRDPEVRSVVGMPVELVPADLVLASNIRVVGAQLAGHRRGGEQEDQQG